MTFVGKITFIALQCSIVLYVLSLLRKRLGKPHCLSLKTFKAPNFRLDVLLRCYFVLTLSCGRNCTALAVALCMYL